MKIIKNIFLFLILFLFSTNLYAKNCSSLYNKTGLKLLQSSKVNLLWLDNKSNQIGQYALINEKKGNTFYLCKKVRSNYNKEDNNIDSLKDLDLDQTFYNAEDAFKAVFQVTSEETTRYILSKLYLPDFGISKSNLVTAFAISQKEEQVSKYITKKSSKETKKVIKKKSSYITKKTTKKPKKKEQKISKKIKSFNDLPYGHIYFYAVDMQKNALIGYVNEDPKSKLMKIGNRKFRKGNGGKMFNLNDGSVCHVYSTVETARLNRVYDGKTTVSCDDSIYSGSWVQKGSEGRGIAINENGDEIDFGFSMDKHYAQIGLNKKLKTYVVKKPVEKKPKKIVKKPKPKKQKKFEAPVENEDKIKPELKIETKYVFNKPNYIIKGKVTDKGGSKKVFVFIDNTPIKVKNGKFEIKRFSPISEKLEVRAIDQWTNETIKLIDVEIKLKAQIVKKLEPLNPSKIRNLNRGDVVALVIGIENYSDAPPANYANRDAKFFAEYARYAFGASRDNVKLLIDKEASLATIFRSLEQWLPSKIQEDQTDVVLFFAGHGLASNDGKDLYLLAHDSARDLLSRTALSRKELFQLINKHNPKSVKVFFDACYSGQTRDDKTLIASARPISIGIKETGGVPDNFTIFTASQLDQISSGFKEAKHGIFSYYLMKGLEGEADKDENREITNGELLAYMKKEVNAKAVELGRKQIPSLVGKKNNTLNRY